MTVLKNGNRLLAGVNTRLKIYRKREKSPRKNPKKYSKKKRRK
jgi:hypothetical protein